MNKTLAYYEQNTPAYYEQNTLAKQNTSLL